MKLAEISNLKIHILMDKVRNLQEAVCADSLRPDRHFYFGPPKVILPGAQPIVYPNSSQFYHCGGLPRVDPRMILGHPS